MKWAIFKINEYTFMSVCVGALLDLDKDDSGATEESTNSDITTGQHWVVHTNNDITTG